MMEDKKTRSFISILGYALILLQLTALVSTSQAHAKPVTSDKSNLDVEIDVGSVHFRGEMAEFYVLVSLSGNRLDVGLSAILYYNGTLNANLTPLVQHVDTGFYRIPYTIPYDASAGTYALVVDACYCSFAGTSLKAFLLSRTLVGWNAWLTEIRDKTASIETDIGAIQLSLEDINAKLTNIDGNIAMIQTEIGTISSNINNIGLKLTKIEDDIATIGTFFGNIQGNITSIKDGVATIKTDIGSVQVDISNLNAKVISFQNSVATIETNIGQMHLDLDQINAKLVELKGNVAAIQTDIGTIKTDVENIKLKVTNVQGDTATIKTILGNLNGTIDTIQGGVATIKTDIGEIKITLTSIKDVGQEDIPTTPLWLILAVVAAIAFVTTVVFLLKKLSAKVS